MYVLVAGMRRHYHESSDCFENPKNPYLYQAPRKKYLPNFPTQKIWELKIQTQENPSIIPVP